MALFGSLALATIRWRIEGQLPNLAKAVVIAAPHDKTADFFIGFAAVFKLRLGVTYLGKASLFHGLLGVVMRWLGGIPVDRHSSNDVVAEVAEKVRESDRMLLALSPEGTRQKVERWRTGFYHIAVQAEVPIVPVALDYDQRCIRIGEPIHASGQIEADRSLFESFFGALTGPIRFS